MYKKLFSWALIAVVALAFVSCSDDKTDPVNTDTTKLETKTLSLDVSDYGLWYYFSFEEDKIIGTGSANPADGDDAAWKARTDWDIAFHRNNVRINSGESGDANGGAKVAASKDWTTENTAPADGYVVDKGGYKIYYDLSGMQQGEVGEAAVSVNDEFIDWALLDHETFTWTIDQRIVYVKTAKGKYAKVFMKNFLDEQDKSGHLTLDYMYQPDGSTTLE